MNRKLNPDDLPFLKDYRKLKSRLSVRLNNSDHLKPDTQGNRFLTSPSPVILI